MNSSGLKQSLADLHLEPLWQRTEGGLKPCPAPEPPQIWPWQDIEPLIDEVIATVPMDQVERRVLTLKNPAPRYRMTTTTRGINCGIQILMPGETAPPHRHSPNALRIALEGNGAATVVNGMSYEMHRGDVILTPSWTMHAHVHHGAERVVWIDFLDVPLYRDLDLIFFEVDGKQAGERPEERPEVGKVHDGPLPVGRFPWQDVAPRIGKGSYEYIDPALGDTALSTLDCRATVLSSTTPADMERSSSAAVCLVMEGEGQTTIGEHTIDWARNDLFTLPHWSWFQHRALSDTAALITVSDRPALRRLGMLQENVRVAAEQQR